MIPFQLNYSSIVRLHFLSHKPGSNIQGSSQAIAKYKMPAGFYCIDTELPGAGLLLYKMLEQPWVWKMPYKSKQNLFSPISDDLWRSCIEIFSQSVKKEWDSFTS